MRQMVEPPALVKPAADLAALAAEINAGVEALEKADRDGLRLALRIGERLHAAREKHIRDGTPWLPWLKKNIHCSQRKAYNCLKIYHGRDKFAHDANIGYSEALKVASSVPDDDCGDLAPVAADQPFRYLTLDAWNKLGEAKRREALAARGDDRFNDQKDNENIEWALWSWNPVTGCLHNCPYCYARDIAERFYAQKFAPSFWPSRLAAPANTPFPAEKAAEWMGHKNVFTCSMADLFGRWVPGEWIEAVLSAVRAAPDWNFLFLTKFPVRMAEFKFPENAWVGTTVDCQARVANAEKAFRKVKAGVKWLSIEPMIEPLRFADLGAFQWVVIGGASRSSQTPAWLPPRRWVVELESAVWSAGGKVYEKRNLYATDVGASRVREYPGVDTVEPTAPNELCYLPTDKG